jgi:hypothetical protein
MLLEGRSSRLSVAISRKRTKKKFRLLQMSLRMYQSAWRTLFVLMSPSKMNGTRLIIAILKEVYVTYGVF